jgi:hypothetical protein
MPPKSFRKILLSLFLGLNASMAALLGSPPPVDFLSRRPFIWYRNVDVSFKPLKGVPIEKTRELVRLPEASGANVKFQLDAYGRWLVRVVEK